MKRLWVLMTLGITAFVATLIILSRHGTRAEVHAAPEVRSIHAPTASLVVTSTADSGYGTLRWAMQTAVASDTITFDPAVFPPGNPVTITLTSSQLPDLDDGNVTIDASNAGVILDGGAFSSGEDGFGITSSGNVIKGMQIINFPGDGVEICCGTVQGNIIGGSTAADRNVISSNGENGIRINGPDVMSNTVSGNYIGTDATGTVAIPNGGNGVSITDGASYNIIGGSNATPGGACSGECNLISGNGNHGVDISGNATMSNTISGNYIGTDASGSATLPSGDPYARGVFINEAPHNTIGGATLGERNVVAGGIHIYSTGADENVVIGNYIGLGADGTSSLALSGDWNGVGISDGARNNRIGGSTTAERNVISGNGGGSGIYFWSSAHGNIIIGNYIGTDATGTLAVPNRYDGVGIAEGSTLNVIGGVNPGESNLISGNTDNGIGIYGTGTVDNMIIGNYIGTDANGTSDLGNGRSGVLISGAAQRNTVGGMTEGERNIISGNGSYGVLVWDDGTDQNTISGNYIGTDVNGSGALGNSYSGILIGGGASANTIGGPTVSDSNVVAYHNAFGIHLYGTSTLSNTISHNSIYSNADKGIELGYGANGYMFPPILTEVSDSAVKGIAVSNSTVEIFSDQEDEGRWFHGSTTVDASGQFTFTAAAPFTGIHVTAAATDPDGNTSEFSSPYAPSRDVVVAAIYVPQLRQEISQPFTPLVRVGNGGTAPETFTVTAVITRASDGALVYSDTQMIVDLGALNYRTLSFDAWTPTGLGNYFFAADLHLVTPDDDPGNDRLIQNFTVADERVDLWSRDNPADDGLEPSVGSVWQSPDIWVRNAADGLTNHQNPINHITNTVYIRMRNRGTLTATNATVTAYWHPPALVIGQSWWESIGTVTTDELAPGAVYTASMPWQPQITGVLTEPYHTCLIDVISSTQDVAPTLWDVRGSNNIEQHNVDVVASSETMLLRAASSSAVSTTFSVGNPYAGEQLVDVLLDTTGLPSGTEVRLDLGGLFERWQRFGQGSLTGAVVISGTTQVALSDEQAVISGLPLMGEELFEVTLEVSGLRGRQGQVDVSERIGGEVLGGVSLQMVGHFELYLPIVMRK